jgi:chromosome segregation ATPase
MKHFLIPITALSLVFGSPLAAQRGGGRGGGGSQQVGGGTQQGAGRGTPQAQGPSAQGQRTQDQTRGLIHATDQQRDQLKACDQSAGQVRKQARALAAVAKSGGANNGDFMRQRDQLHEQIQAMQRDHQQFVSGLTSSQQASLADRIRAMDRDREQINSRIRQLDAELAKPDPQRKRIEEHAREIEKAMKDWQQQYRRTQSDTLP